MTDTTKDEDAVLRFLSEHKDDKPNKGAIIAGTQLSRIGEGQFAIKNYWSESILLGAKGHYAPTLCGNRYMKIKIFRDGVRNDIDLRCHPHLMCWSLAHIYDDRPKFEFELALSSLIQELAGNYSDICPQLRSRSPNLLVAGPDQSSGYKSKKYGRDSGDHRIMGFQKSSGTIESQYSFGEKGKTFWLLLGSAICFVLGTLTLLK